LRISSAEPIGQVGDEDRQQQGDADTLSGGKADPEYRLLGNAVEKGAEGQGRAAT
jgi:hypothetical protein